jgi:hypothetical protein
MSKLNVFTNIHTLALVFLSLQKVGFTDEQKKVLEEVPELDTLVSFYGTTTGYVAITHTIPNGENVITIHKDSDAAAIASMRMILTRLDIMSKDLVCTLPGEDKPYTDLTPYWRDRIDQAVTDIKNFPMASGENMGEAIMARLQFTRILSDWTDVTGEVFHPTIIGEDTTARPPVVRLATLSPRSTRSLFDRHGIAPVAIEEEKTAEIPVVPEPDLAGLVVSGGLEPPPRCTGPAPQAGVYAIPPRDVGGARGNRTPED